MAEAHFSPLGVVGTVAISAALLFLAALPSAARDVPAFSYNQRRVSTATVPADADSDISDNEYPYSEISTNAPISGRWYGFAQAPSAFLAAGQDDWPKATTVPRGAGRTFTQLNARELPSSEVPIEPSMVFPLGDRGNVGGFEEVNLQDLPPGLPEEMPEGERPSEAPKRFAAVKGRLAATRGRLDKWRQNMRARFRRWGEKMRSWLRRKRRGGGGGGEEQARGLGVSEPGMAVLAPESTV